MTDDIPKCGTCRYFERAGPTAPGMEDCGWDHCRRTMSNDEVTPEDWCGEHSDLERRRDLMAVASGAIAGVIEGFAMTNGRAPNGWEAAEAVFEYADSVVRKMYGEPQRRYGFAPPQEEG